MAILHIPDENRTLTEFAEVRDHLASIGITYERWEPAHQIAPDAPPVARATHRPRSRRSAHGAARR